MRDKIILLLAASLFVAATIPTDTFLSYSPVQIWNAHNPEQVERYRGDHAYMWTFEYTTVAVDLLENGTALIETYRARATVSVSYADWSDCRDRFVYATCVNYLVRGSDPVTDPQTGRTYYSASYIARMILMRNLEYVVDQQRIVQAYIDADLLIQENLAWP